MRNTLQARKISLASGSGGKEMQELIQSLGINYRGKWKECDNDSAALDIGKQKIVFTTDSFVVDPIFFPGGDIGKIAVCGTINDLCVVGATPLGLSLALVIEEGFGYDQLEKIMNSIRRMSTETQVPIVTGDTKVVPKGKLDKIMINTSGVGISKKILIEKPNPGDKIIVSGGIGEHAAAVLSKRFEYKTDIRSDAKPIKDEMNKLINLIKLAKDPTRGGLAASLNEICQKNKTGMIIYENSVPIKKQVRAIAEILGIDTYQMASEGRFVCIAKPENEKKVLIILRRYNRMAATVGTVTKGDKVIVQTELGKRIMPMPTGRIVARIC
ncbi:MAG: hydrogenase expression/formation protein HypE [Candidatus Woesearchaeota archaeon]